MCNDPLALPRVSEPITPPRPVDQTAPPWLYPPSAPPGTIVPSGSTGLPRPSGSTLVSRCSSSNSNFGAFGCAYFLHLFGSASVLRNPGSTSATRHCGSALAFWSFCVACSLHPSDSAWDFTSLGVASVGRAHDSTLAPPSISSAVFHYCPGWLLGVSSSACSEMVVSSTGLDYPLIYTLI